MELRTFSLISIATLGFLSGLLSFIAEGEKLAEGDITKLASNECIHSRSPALALGFTAALALLIAQIISNSLGGCICCESRLNDPSGKTTPVAIAIGCLTLSWVTFSIAFLLLVAGASINDRRDASDENLSAGCYVLKSGVFTGAAFASMTTAILGIAYNLQVFTIRKNITATVPGAVDGGMSLPNVALNSNNARYSVRITQGNLAARPSFSTEQNEKAKAVLDRKTTYPRRSVSPQGETKILEMASSQSEKEQADDKRGSKHMRRTLANTEISGVQASNQMRKTLVLQQQGNSGPVEYHGSRSASQSASAPYDLSGTYSSVPPFEHEEEGASLPLYARSGGSTVWEQSNFDKAG